MTPSKVNYVPEYIPYLTLGILSINFMETQTFNLIAVSKKFAHKLNMVAWG
jgi:hypothetical protein